MLIFEVDFCSRFPIVIRKRDNNCVFLPPDRLAFLSIQLPPFLPNKAQEQDDIILDHAWYDVENATYVDVGADHLSVISVTRAFDDANSHRINIKLLFNTYIVLMKQRCIREFFAWSDYGRWSSSQRSDYVWFGGLKECELAFQGGGKSDCVGITNDSDMLKFNCDQF
jgi:hypothetical protein